jgi:hypothetical protein
MNKNVLILVFGILLGCIILGGFYYISETNKQQVDLQGAKELQQQEYQLQHEPPQETTYQPAP